MLLARFLVCYPQPTLPKILCSDMVSQGKSRCVVSFSGSRSWAASLIPTAPDRAGGRLYDTHKIRDLVKGRAGSCQRKSYPHTAMDFVLIHNMLLRGEDRRKVELAGLIRAFFGTEYRRQNRSKRKGYQVPV